MAWVRRFQKNIKPGTTKQTGNISVEEFQAAEDVVLKLMQEETIPKQCDSWEGLLVTKSDDDLYHVKKN